MYVNVQSVHMVCVCKCTDSSHGLCMQMYSQFTWFMYVNVQSVHMVYVCKCTVSSHGLFLLLLYVFVLFGL